jgi:hypothetical protein
MRAYLVALAFLVSACGDDDPPPPAPKAPGAPGAAKAAPKPKGKQIAPMKRIEERVTCPAPSDAKKCDPKVPICAAGQYCIPAGADHYCGACPERDAIRHTFKPRDFQGVDIRDPFQSFVIVPAGLGTGPEGKVPTEATPKCTRKEQFVASAANYQTLKIIGIVSQGTQRKVLLSDGRVGHIVKKGDCVGKEKAVVKDIGAGYITFAVEAAGKSDPIEVSMQLYPTQVQLGAPDAIDPGAASAPMVAPPSGTAPTPAPQPAPDGQTTTIIQQKGTTTTTTPNVPPPPQAPVQLKP